MDNYANLEKSIKVSSGSVKAPYSILASIENWKEKRRSPFLKCSLFNRRLSEVHLEPLQKKLNSNPTQEYRKKLILAISFRLKDYRSIKPTRDICEKDIFISTDDKLCIIPKDSQSMTLCEDLAKLFEDILSKYTGNTNFWESTDGHIARHFCDKVRSDGLGGGFNHPYFWNATQKINFIIKVYNLKLKKNAPKLFFSVSGRVITSEETSNYDWREVIVQVDANDDIAGDLNPAVGDNDITGREDQAVGGDDMAEGLDPAVANGDIAGRAIADDSIAVGHSDPAVADGDAGDNADIDIAGDLDPAVGDVAGGMDQADNETGGNSDPAVDDGEDGNNPADARYIFSNLIQKISGVEEIVPKKYDVEYKNTVFGLISFFRNLYSHLNEKSEKLQRTLGKDHLYWYVFSTKFPSLITAIYDEWSAMAEFEPVEVNSLTSD